MTLNPRVGMYLSLAAAICSVLVLCGTELTTLFGAANEVKILAALAIINVIINSANGVLHMIPSGGTPAALAQFPLGPPIAPQQAQGLKVVALLAILVLGALIVPTPGYAQAQKQRDLLGIPGGVVRSPAAPFSAIEAKQSEDITKFLTDLADISGAITLSTQIPGLQDPVGNACWLQFNGIGELLKAHPSPLNLKLASDWEALRLLAIGLNQVCANPNCGQMFVDATNAVSALAAIPTGISLQSLCSKVPVIGTSAVPTAAVPTAGIGTVATPPAK